VVTQNVLHNFDQGLIHLLLSRCRCVDQTMPEEGGATVVSVAAFTFISSIQWFPVNRAIQLLCCTLHRDAIFGLFSTQCSNFPLKINSRYVLRSG